MILLESKISSFTLLKISCTVICSKFNSMGCPTPSDMSSDWIFSFRSWAKLIYTSNKGWADLGPTPTSKAWWLQESLLLTQPEIFRTSSRPKRGRKTTPQNSWVVNCQHELLGRWISLHQRYGVISYWLVRAKQKMSWVLEIPHHHSFYITE